jgi:hypothetical protein
MGFVLWYVRHHIVRGSWGKAARLRAGRVKNRSLISARKIKFFFTVSRPVLRLPHPPIQTVSRLNKSDHEAGHSLSFCGEVLNVWSSTCLFSIHLVVVLLLYIEFNQIPYLLHKIQIHLRNSKIICHLHVITEVRTVLPHICLTNNFHWCILLLVVFLPLFLTVCLPSLFCTSLCCVITATRAWQDNRRIEVRFQARKRFIPLPQYSDRLQGPPSLLFIGHWGHISQQ